VTGAKKRAFNYQAPFKEQDRNFASDNAQGKVAATF
jgi:hypothetical protein